MKVDLIKNWRQTGSLHLWRYKPEKRGLTGWHLKGDKSGIDSAIALLELMRDATYPAKRTLNLTKPSERTVNGPFSPVRGHKVISPQSLQLSLNESESDELWELSEEGGKARLQLGRKSLARLADALRELQERGYGDFSVGPVRGEQPQNIWLW
jgi:hypothetical protein